MKKNYLFVLAILLAISTNAQTTLASQGFEESTDDTWSYNTTPETYNISNDVWAIVTNVGSITTADTGANFWGIRDIENNNGGGAMKHYLEFSNIPVTGENNIVLSFKYYSDGFDSTDELSVEFFFDDVGQDITPLEKNTDVWTGYSKVIPDGTNNVRFNLIATQNGATDYAGFDSIKLESGADTNSNITITYPTEGETVNAGLDGFDATTELYLFAISGNDGSGHSDNTEDGIIQYSIDSGALINKFDNEPITFTNLTQGPHTLFTQLVDNNENTLGIESTVNFIYNDIVQTLPFYEPFDYVVNENLGDQTNWVNQVANDDDEILIGTGSLSYPSLDNSIGNHIMFDGDGKETIIEFTPVASGTVYTSFIINVTDLSALTDFNDGGYFAILGEFDARLWVRANPDASGTTYDIGAGHSPSSPPVTSTTYNVGDNVFIVVSYDIDNNVVKTWVNPSEAELQSSSPGSPTITEATTDTADPISYFYLRQDSTGETPFMSFDELRIGTSWSDVTPTTLSNNEFETTGFAIYPNPVTNGLVNIISKTDEAITVSVFDILGKQVINQTVNNNVLNVASLTSGVYILKASQNGSVSTKKLVIK
ncbi:T9SS type A sorting domain-containing protein [Lacinutrix himadriensis]|uniref:T9SS type A sorting domain-containing protein n=1 Tax=Lacinutrix himadriensis TaxID=641549 RepID=UPI0006E35E6D|nr:T9SS type A sorting domain-containing protein [Lacinutrix himadriensis]